MKLWRRSGTWSGRSPFKVAWIRWNPFTSDLLTAPGHAHCKASFESAV
jgi:hypothetical protein